MVRFPEHRHLRVTTMAIYTLTIQPVQLLLTFQLLSQAHFSPFLFLIISPLLSLTDTCQLFFQHLHPCLRIMALFATHVTQIHSLVPMAPGYSTYPFLFLPLGKSVPTSPCHPAGPPLLPTPELDLELSLIYSTTFLNMLLSKMLGKTALPSSLTGAIRSHTRTT